MFIKHGDDDRDVPFYLTTDLVEKLRAQNVAFEELIFPDEIHDLAPLERLGARPTKQWLIFLTGSLQRHRNSDDRYGALYRCCGRPIARDHLSRNKDLYVRLREETYRVMKWPEMQVDAIEVLS